MAKKLYEQLEELLNGRLAPEEASAETRGLAEAANTLRAMGDVIPESTGRSDIRERLLQGIPEAETAATLPATRGWLNRLFQRKTAALLLACAMTFSGAAMAAASSLPGSTLYPLKRAMEQARVAAALGDKNRAALQLDHAETRLAEMRRLVVTDDREALPALSSAFENDIQHALDIANKLPAATSKPLINRARSLVIRQFELFDKLLRSTERAQSTIEEPTIKSGSDSGIESADQHDGANDADSVEDNKTSADSDSKAPETPSSPDKSEAQPSDNTSANSQKSEASDSESARRSSDSKTVNKD